ncbi:MAG: hypothetical protein EBT96_07855 [Betaproteobacteria bacterium]|nr:hypothetical protein [Betaproteobacteria bacterium]
MPTRTASPVGRLFGHRATPSLSRGSGPFVSSELHFVASLARRDKLFHTIGAMDHINPLATGNRLQRAYYRWARPHYERIGLDDPELAREIEEVDQFLYSRRGAIVWLGCFLGLVGVMLGFRTVGDFDWLGAILQATVLWFALIWVVMAAWFSPKRKGNSKITVSFGGGLLVGLLCGVLGLLFGQWLRHGEVDWQHLQHLVERGAWPALLLVVGLTLVVAVVSWAGKAARAQRLQRLQLLAERDAARAVAAETELRLLQAQIHPHFVFNTLATLQHWVDRADPRAGPLLRELTSFLRGSTEMLGRSVVPLGEEVQAAAHYLAIMQARMGDRLRFEIELDPQCAAQKVPPGLLLTLVENAIEHGLEPKIDGGTLRLSGGCGDAGTGGWWLRVEDDGLGLSPEARDQVGLSNLRQRLQQHYGSKARFTLQALGTGGTRAELHFEEA